MKNNQDIHLNNNKVVNKLPAIDLNTPSLQAHLEKGWQVLRKAKSVLDKSRV